MSIEIESTGSDDDDDNDRVSHPSLAMGTSGDRQERTRIESPGGRHKTPVPQQATKRAPTRPPPTPSKGSDDPDNRLGSTLGVYRLSELLGKGGMGYVYKAEHIKLGREVALKLLRGDYAKRRDAVLRFFQEAKTVNRVRHRNIVDVTDFVELDDGTTFIIMELLRGQSLGRWARTGVDLPRALAVLVQICDGLGAAHAVGVVHRDLKPDNVIVVPTSDGAELVKLLDFGVAKLLNRDDHDDDIGFQTAAGSVIGTPAYMSPEQAGGMAVDHRSDIYSLGAIMYELFCGQPMFRGRSFGEYVRKHLTEFPTPPRQTQNGANIDERLEGLILKSLAKDPNERFSHILELRDGLLHLLGGIETQPPGSIVLSHSSIRSAPTMAPQHQMLPPHMLPLIPAMVTTQPTPGAASPSQAHMAMSGQHSSLGYSQFVVGQQSQQHEKPTPLFVWFVGGAIAVGLGIGGALWYANKQPAATAAPAVAPVTSPTTTTTPIEQPAPKLVELRFDSLPSGGVFADGRSAELCQTPCSFNVDLGDGGPANQRAFVVRAEGYADSRVIVDFTGPQRDFSVSLARLAPTGPTIDTSAEDIETVDLTGDGTRPGSKKKKKKGKTRVEEPEVEEAAQKPPEPPPEVKIEKPVEKPVKKIDRTDTIDPFKR